MYWLNNRTPLNIEPVSSLSPLNLIYLSKQYCQQDKTVPTARKLYRLRKKWRKIVFQNGAVECYICRRPLTVESATMDHVVPISKGGIWNDLDNIKPACYICNQKKADLYG